MTWEQLRPWWHASVALAGTITVAAVMSAGGHRDLAARAAVLAKAAADSDVARSAGHVERRRVYAQFRRPARFAWPQHADPKIVWDRLPGPAAESAAPAALLPDLIRLAAGAGRHGWER